MYLINLFLVMDQKIIFKNFKKNFYKYFIFKRRIFLLKKGVNIVGYASFSLGIGEDCRSTFNAIKSW